MTQQCPWPRAPTWGCDDTIFASLKCTLKPVFIKDVSSDFDILCVSLPLQWENNVHVWAADVLSDVPLLKPMLKLLLTLYNCIQSGLVFKFNFAWRLDAGVGSRFLRDDEVMFICHDVDHLFLRSFFFDIELHELLAMCIPFFVRDASCSDWWLWRGCTRLMVFWSHAGMRVSPWKKYQQSKTLARKFRSIPENLMLFSA